MSLSQIKEPDTNIAALMVQLNTSIDSLLDKTAEQQEWLNKYFSKPKAARKSMFYKYSWFGIPVNK
jgi:hypothetical protein